MRGRFTRRVAINILIFHDNKFCQLNKHTEHMTKKCNLYDARSHNSSMPLNRAANSNKKCASPLRRSFIPFLLACFMVLMHFVRGYQSTFQDHLIDLNCRHSYFISTNSNYEQGLEINFQVWNTTTCTNSAFEPKKMCCRVFNINFSTNFNKQNLQILYGWDYNG